MDRELQHLLDPAAAAATGPRAVLADGRRVFIKRRADAADDFFAAEARGLAALAATHTLRIPNVFAVAATGIALEDLGSGRAAMADWERAGRALARMHRAGAELFGFAADGYCGDSPQDNTAHADGYVFFATCRLLPQARRAADAGLLSGAEVRRVEAIAQRLPSLLPDAPPVLIHGDLWTGNLHACANGELALIDAGAVHHGWAECDLAMLVLFGAPPQAFLAAYADAAGSDFAWRERAPLLNLYHLLNHLNLFGGGYLGAVREVLRRYA